MPIDRVINGGGIPQKNEMLNRVYANVLNKPVLVPESEVTSLGSAIFAFLAAGAFKTIEEAQDSCARSSARSSRTPKRRRFTSSFIRSTGSSTLRWETGTPKRWRWAISCPGYGRSPRAEPSGSLGAQRVAHGAVRAEQLDLHLGLAGGVGGATQAGIVSPNYRLHAVQHSFPQVVAVDKRSPPARWRDSWRRFCDRSRRSNYPRESHPFRPRGSDGSERHAGPR